MKIISKLEAGMWCRSRGLSLTESGLPEVGAIPDVFDFLIPSDAGQRVASAKDQIGNLAIDTSCLVWLDDWSVWPSGQWHHLFERFRLSYGYKEQLIDRPAHIIDKVEVDAAISIAVYAVLMLWDCYVITDRGAWLFYSHDGFGRMKREPNREGEGL